MGKRLGEILYWLTCGLSVIWLILVGVVAYSNPPSIRGLNLEIGILGNAIPAIFVWLLGRACRYGLSGY